MGGHRIQAGQLGTGLDVKTANTGVQGLFHFGSSFADTGKHNARRVAPGAQNAREFTAGDDVETRAEPSQKCQHRQVGIGLDGVAHQMRVSIQRLVEGAPVALQRGPRIDVQGSTLCGRQLGDIYVFGHQPAIFVVEIIHAGY